MVTTQKIYGVKGIRCRTPALNEPYECEITKDIVNVEGKTETIVMKEKDINTVDIKMSISYKDTRGTTFYPELIYKFESWFEPVNCRLIRGQRFVNVEYPDSVLICNERGK